MQEHCLGCADCRELVALVSQAVRGVEEASSDAGFTVISRLGEEAAHRARDQVYWQKSLPRPRGRELRGGSAILSKQWQQRRVWVWGLAAVSLAVIVGLSSYYTLF